MSKREPSTEEWAVSWDLAAAILQDLNVDPRVSRGQHTAIARRLMGLLRQHQEPADSTGLRNRLFWSRVLIQRTRPLVESLRRLLPNPAAKSWRGPLLSIDGPAGSVLLPLHPAAAKIYSEHRDAFWGQPQTPFLTWAAALQWLKRQEADALAPSELERLSPTPRTLSLPVDESAECDGEGYYQVSCANLALHHIWGLTQQLQAATGWQQGTALAHLLSGSLPFMGGVRIWRGTALPRAELLIYPGVTTQREFELAMKAVWEAFDSSLTLTDADIELLDAMRAVGAPPDKIGPGRRSGSTDYWRAVGESIGQSWDACRKRWDRLAGRWQGAEDYVSGNGSQNPGMLPGGCLCGEEEDGPDA